MFIEQTYVNLNYIDATLSPVELQRLRSNIRSNNWLTIISKKKQIEKCSTRIFPNQALDTHSSSHCRRGCIAQFCNWPRKIHQQLKTKCPESTTLPNEFAHFANCPVSPTCQLMASIAQLLTSDCKWKHIHRRRKKTKSGIMLAPYKYQRQMGTALEFATFACRDPIFRC